jgi:hypothetical protein
MLTSKLMRPVLQVAVVLTCVGVVGCGRGSKTASVAGDSAPSASTAPVNFDVRGVYVETCACKPPCACEMVAVESGCQGLGAFKLTSGRYMGTDLSGVKIAYAMVPGEWVRLYVDARPEQTDAATAFARAVTAKFGPLEATREASIDIKGTDGAYTVLVDNGKVMTFQTEAILGGDKKSPIAHSNVHNILNPTCYQGQSVQATYRDDNRKINLPKGRNSYFNPAMSAKGKI